MRKIITGTDFSEPSYQAVRVAGQLAKCTGAALNLVHVIAHGRGVALPGAPGMGGSVNLATVAGVQSEGLREEAELRLAQRRSEVLADVPDVQPQIVFDASAAAALLDLSEDDDVDLLVVGSHGRTGLDRILLGSVAERLVRHASCPVLTVRSAADVGRFPRRIVAATDFSSQSMTGIDLAGSWAEQFSCPLHVLHVYDTTPFWPFTKAEEQVSLDEVRRPLQRTLEQLHRARFGGSVEVTMRLLASESVAGGICGYADEEDVDLVVLSTLGHSGVKRMLLGTVAEKVVRHAPCSVLTTPAGEPPAVGWPERFLASVCH